MFSIINRIQGLICKRWNWLINKSISKMQRDQVISLKEEKVKRIWRKYWVIENICISVNFLFFVDFSISSTWSFIEFILRNSKAELEEFAELLEFYLGAWIWFSDWILWRFWPFIFMFSKFPNWNPPLALKFDIFNGFCLINFKFELKLN